MQQQQNAAENFLATIDTSLRPSDHLKNCFRDARAYNWPFSTVIKILDGIEKAYANKEATNE